MKLLGTRVLCVAGCHVVSAESHWAIASPMRHLAGTVTEDDWKMGFHVEQGVIFVLNINMFLV